MTPDTTLAKLAKELPRQLPEWPYLPVESSLRSAVKAVTKEESLGLVLTKDSEPCGVLTTFDLLRALLLDIDAVTGLPRSGALRDWLADRIHEGQEVAVVFIDLDNFGTVNKEIGHTAGDVLLALVASVVRGLCGNSEFAARFGGDEFAIGTVRDRAGAEALSAALKSELPVGATFGLSGGRRCGAREGAHIVSTVEELLRLASLDCMSKKRR